MLSMLDHYLERLQALHADIELTITGLPQATLDWVPRPEMNSLAVLAVHVAGPQRYWIGDVVGGDPSGREFTGAWCLAHALEHTALHLGQMQITRQLWEQRG